MKWFTHAQYLDYYTDFTPCEFFTPTHSTASDPLGHKNNLSRLRRRSWKKTQMVLGLTDWMLRSQLIINPESIFLQHSPPLSSSSFHVSLPSQHFQPSHCCLRCDIMLPGNSLFFYLFSSLLWYEGVDGIWPTHSPAPLLFCVWVDGFWAFVHQILEEKITVTVFIKQSAEMCHLDIVRHMRLNGVWTTFTMLWITKKQKTVLADENVNVLMSLSGPKGSSSAGRELFD